MVPPPHTEMRSCFVSSITSPASKRPSGQTLVLPDMTVDTAIDIPDTWNNGYGASRARWRSQPAARCDPGQRHAARRR